MIEIINAAVKVWVWLSVAFMCWIAWGAFRMWRDDR